MKINVGLGRKIPGDEQYSSKDAWITLEAEVDQSLANDPPKLQVQIKKLYQIAFDAVIDELYNRAPNGKPRNNKAEPPPPKAPPPGNGTQKREPAGNRW
jgi:hypothetical protein